MTVEYTENESIKRRRFFDDLVAALKEFESLDFSEMFLPCYDKGEWSRRNLEALISDIQEQNLPVRR